MSKNKSIDEIFAEMIPQLQQKFGEALAEALPEFVAVEPESVADESGESAPATTSPNRNH